MGTWPNEQHLMGENMRKGQASTEILVLIGMFLLLLLPLLFYAYSRTNITNEDLSVQKAEFAASRLATAADSVGYLGGEAAVVEEIETPPNLNWVEIHGSDIIFDMQSSSGKKQVVKSSAFNISAQGLEKMSAQGTYFVEIAAISDYARRNTAQVSMTLK